MESVQSESEPQEGTGEFFPNTVYSSSGKQKVVRETLSSFNGSYVHTHTYESDVER